MDSLWRSELYSPSTACEVAAYQDLEPFQLQEEISELQRLTKSLSVLPYDPETWLCRARCFRALGYPELCLGDAHKARLLVEAALLENSLISNQVMLTYGMRTWLLYTTDPSYSKWSVSINEGSELLDRVIALLTQIEIQIWSELMEGLMAANCCSDYLRLSKQAVIKFPDDSVFPSEVANAESWSEQRKIILENQGMSAEVMETTLDNGGVYPRAYPWMPKDMSSRSSTILDDLKAEFRATSTNAVVARSSIAEVLGVDDVFGVIAVEDIAKGETVLMDDALAGVLSDPKSCPTCCSRIIAGTANECCSVQYCSGRCAQTALSTYHGALCNNDFTFLQEPAKSAVESTDFSLDSLLLLRILALSIHESAPHPLYSSLMARLTPAYDTDHLIVFNFQDHIVTPMLTLEALSIDIFANAEYDTWVLHTMRCRKQNNKHGHYLNGFPGSAVSPLYSMFNHSCEPNVDWEHGIGADGSTLEYGESSTVRMYAERAIKKGEELFICYLKPRSMEWAERQEALGAWWDGGCVCARCLREAPEIADDITEEE